MSSVCSPFPRARKRASSCRESHDSRIRFSPGPTPGKGFPRNGPVSGPRVFGSRRSLGSPLRVFETRPPITKRFADGGTAVKQPRTPRGQISHARCIGNDVIVKPRKLAGIYIQTQEQSSNVHFPGERVWLMESEPRSHTRYRESWRFVLIVGMNCSYAGV